MKTKSKISDPLWFKTQLDLKVRLVDIGKKAGVSINTVCIWKHRHGFMDYNSGGKGRYLSQKALSTYTNHDWLIFKIESGLTAVDLAKETGMSVGIIYIWAAKLGVSLRRKKIYADKNWLSGQVAQGLSDEEIAFKLNCKTSVIRWWRRHFGIKKIKRKNKYAEDRKIFGNWLSGCLNDFDLTAEEMEIIIKYFGVNEEVQYLRHIVKSLGMTHQNASLIVKRACCKIVAKAGIEALKDFPYIVKLVESQRRCVNKFATYRNKKWLLENVSRGAGKKEMAEAANAHISTIERWCAHYNIHL